MCCLRVARSRSRILLVGSGDAEHGQRIGVAPTLLLAIDDARGERHGSCRQFEEVAVEIGGDRREFVAAAIARGEENIVECLRCQIADAEIIGARDRRAGRKPAFAGIECIGKSEEHTSELQYLMPISYYV